MNKRHFIRSVAATLAAIASFGAVKASAQAEVTEIDLRFGFIANVQNADHYIAIDQGIFERNGIELNVIPGGPGAPNSLTELAAGNVQIALSTWIAFTDAVQRGNDFVLIGTQFQSSPLGVISLGSDPILEAGDMQGARILAQGNAARNMVRATMAANGLDADALEFVPTGFSPEPLLAGDGKGYTGFGTNQAVTLEILGYERDQDFFFRSFDELGVANISGLFVVERAYLEENRDLMVRFMASLIEAQEISENDLELGARLATEVFGIDYGLDLEQQIIQNGRQIEFIRPGADPDFLLYSLDTDKISGPMMETLRLLGREDLPTDFLDHVDATIVADAYARVDG